MRVELTDLIDALPGLGWTALPDGRAEFLNQRWLAFTGMTAEAAAGWGWVQAIHPDDRARLVEHWRSCVASGAPVDAEGRMRRHDGAYRWFIFRANPLRDGAGQVTKWCGSNLDIEDRQCAEADAEQAYLRLAEAQRLSKTGSFVLDLLTDEHSWSDEAIRIFELAPATKVTAQMIRAMVHPEDVPSFDAVIARAMTVTDVDFLFRIVTARGAVKHVRGIARLTTRQGGQPRFIGALQDVTDSKLAEAALDRARAELAHVARVTMLNTFTASIAHELNQPLLGIITNASTCLRMLERSPPNIDGARETARRTIRDGNRASDVIVRLRGLFTKKDFTLEPLDLNDAAREVIAFSSSYLQRKRVILRVDLAEGLPLIVGDRVQMQQVILNLLRNASDAMGQVEDRPRELLIKTEPDTPGRVRLAVRDVGIGLGAEAKDRLFEPLYTTKSDGMGIGLSVSRSIIEKHHGCLWAEPNDGPGATFAFSIPCGGASAAPADLR